VLDVPYRRLPRDDIATWGSALIAGHAVGLIPDMAEAAARASEPKGTAMSPRPENVARYRKIVPDYIVWQDSMDAR
jgi:xylulokinase